MTENKGSASAPSSTLLDEPQPDGPKETAPAPTVNREVGRPRIVIGYAQGKLRDETRAVGEHMGAELVDLTGDDRGYFKLLTRLWESARGFVLLEQDVVPTVALLDDMWACDREWCSAFFWQWDGPVLDGETRPRQPRRYRVSETLALHKFGTALLHRAPRAMQEVATRTNNVTHYNQIDLALVHGNGVLQSHPYNAVPHLHGPVDHRTPPAWVPLIGEGEWVDG